MVRAAALSGFYIIAMAIFLLAYSLVPTLS